MEGVPTPKFSYAAETITGTTRTLMRSIKAKDKETLDLKNSVKCFISQVAVTEQLKEIAESTQTKHHKAEKSETKFKARSLVPHETGQAPAFARRSKRWRLPSQNFPERNPREVRKRNLSSSRQKKLGVEAP